jgi:hypothetical protein
MGPDQRPVRVQAHLSESHQVDLDMNGSQHPQHLTVQRLYDFAAHQLLEQGKTSYEVQQLLIQKGLEPASAHYVVTNIEDQIRQAEKKRARRDMLFGGLWLVGGIAATASGIGLIFWGAIVFGLIQFGRGVAKLV